MKVAKSCVGMSSDMKILCVRTTVVAKGYCYHGIEPLNRIHVLKNQLFFSSLNARSTNQTFNNSVV